MKQHLIKIRLVGENIKPSSKRAGDIGEILQTLEALFIARTLSLFTDAKREDTFISLLAIEDKSIGLHFAPSSQEKIYSAYLDIAHCIRQDCLHKLDALSLKHLKNFVSLSKKHQFVAKFSTASEQDIAQISESLNVPESKLVTASGKIHGYVTRVGGKEAKVVIEIGANDSLSCKVSAKNAKKLGKHLYSHVEFFGKKTWDSLNHKIVSFDIESFEAKEMVSVNNAIDNIARLIDKDYTQQDPDKLAYNIRHKETF